MNKAPGIATLGELKKAGYKPRSVKDELRENLINALREGRNVFQGIQGFEDTVIPQIQTAILSRHNIILLGLRGQAVAVELNRRVVRKKDHAQTELREGDTLELVTLVGGG